MEKKINIIPKKIHYCWFGGKKLPRKAIKCIKSWKRYFPDYEIIEWNESNFDINCCDYVKEAYKEKKYAFVSDFARLKIIYDEGGIYFDTDVEVIRKFDGIIEENGFMGIEQIRNNEITVNPGLGFAAPKGSEIINSMYEKYLTMKFEYKEKNTTTIVQIATECLKRYNLKNKNEIQKINEITVYPKEYFNPINMENYRIEKTDNTYSIHLFCGSWVSHYTKARKKVYIIITNILGTKVAHYIQSKIVRKNKNVE